MGGPGLDLGGRMSWHLRLGVDWAQVAEGRHGCVVNCDVRETVAESSARVLGLGQSLARGMCAL